MADNSAPGPFLPAADTRPNDVAWPILNWPPSAATVLCGHQVQLRVADPDRDAQALFTALDHDAVWAHVAGRPADPASFAALLRARLAAGLLPWIVSLTQPVAGRPVGATVGTSSFLDVEVNDARLEIGFTAYTPAVWGTVVNPATKLALLGFAFEQLGAGRVQLKTDVRNHRSQRAIAGLGAGYEGRLRRYQRRADNTVRDTAVFSVIAEDWPAVRAGLQRRLSAPG